MTDELKAQIEQDIETAKLMSEIGAAAEIRDLVNRLIGYLDLVNSAIADYEHGAAKLKGKKRTLEEFIRSGKEMAKAIEIDHYTMSKK